MRLRWSFALAVLALIAVAAGTAWGHAERPVEYPNPAAGSVPELRKTGKAHVVCKRGSRRRLRSIYRGNKRVLRARLRLVKRCRYRHIQSAVDAARNGHRILVLPGVYREKPSRAVPTPDPRCKGMVTDPLTTGTSLGATTPGNAFGEGVSTTKVPTYEHHARCPNSLNLITIAGDGPDRDRVCSRPEEKCNIQLQGMGRRPEDVLIEGDRIKENVIRADRADGVHLRNFSVQYSDFNNIYVLETNGFRMERIISRYSYEYGFLSFVSDNGLYARLEATGAGDSGIYPGSGPQRADCDPGIEVRDSKSYGNLLGFSGTAGDNVWIHDSEWYGNVVGISLDSFIGGHPGLPTNCTRIEDNEIHSNNLDLFDAEHDELCSRAAAAPNGARRREVLTDPAFVCPTFAAPIGTGIMLAGANDMLVQDNQIWNNWREGTKQFWVPAAVRGDYEPDKQYDTSNRNRYVGNVMGVAADGTRDPNGVDFWWDQEGAQNCWERNRGPDGTVPTSDPPALLLPLCPGGPFTTGNSAKTAEGAPCAAFDQRENREPIGCDWVIVPPEPR